MKPEPHRLSRTSYPYFRFVIASIRISYLAEAHYPGDYEVGLGATRFGNTSFDIGCGLFLGETCVGVCDTTQVTIGATGPITVPQALRVALEKKSLAPA